MRERRSNTLPPLTKITSGRVKFKYTKTKQYAFGEIKLIVDRETLLIYPYFKEEFKINTNTSDFQLGAVIRLKGKSIAFHGRKVTDTQGRYTVK